MGAILGQINNIKENLSVYLDSSIRKSIYQNKWQSTIYDDNFVNINSEVIYDKKNGGVFISQNNILNTNFYLPDNFFTINIWVKRTTNSDGVIISQQANNINNSFTIRNVGNVLICSLGTITLSYNKFFVNNWYFISVSVLENFNLVLYINGTQIQIVPGTFSSVNEYFLHIFSSSDNIFDNFTGEIGVISIYNTPLIDEEVKFIHWLSENRFVN